MSEGHKTVVFRRCEQDNKHWWHWRTDCQIWKSAWAQKRRGWTFVYETKEDGSRPTTFSHCPGCDALDKRVQTKCHPYAVTKVVVVVQRLASPPPVFPVRYVAAMPPRPVMPSVPRYYYNNISGL